jgi:hypothetical protein
MYFNKAKFSRAHNELSHQDLTGFYNLSGLKKKGYLSLRYCDNLLRTLCGMAKLK